MANILTRREQLGISSIHLSANQQKMDQIDEGFTTQMGDISSAAAVLSGGLAYRVSKIGILSMEVTGEAPLLFKTLAPTVGLAAEVSSYRSVNSWLSPESKSSQSWMSDFFNFGALKTFGNISPNKNIIFQNFIQNAGMVATQNLATALGQEAPQGNLIDQFISAEVLSAQTMLGLNILYHLSSGKISHYEKSLDLAVDTLQSPQNPSPISFEDRLPQMAATQFDDLGFPIEASAAKKTQARPKYSRYFWKFYNPERSLFNPFKGHEYFGQLGISRDFGTAVIGKDGVSIIHFAANHPVEMKDYEANHVPASESEAYQRISSERYEEKKDRFPTYASLFWHFFLGKRNEALADRLFQIAAEVAAQNPKFANFTVQDGEFTPFLRRFISKPNINEYPSQLAYCTEVSRKFLGEIYTQYGIDPLLFALRVQDQMISGYYLSTPHSNDLLFAAFNEGKTSEGKTTQVVTHIPAIQRAWTIDIFQNLLEEKPWQKDFDPFHSEKVSSSGILYTSYYQGERPEDFTDLYYALRNSNLDSIEKQKLLETAASTMLPLIDAARTNNDTLLLPIISGSFPTEELASKLGESTQIQVLANPWEPRPPQYGAGVEGKILASKIELVGKYLKLRYGMAAQINGKDIILVDDNITDGVTFLMAQVALYKAGARSVRLITLTHTVRNSTASF